jgi:hypothetical protein
MIALEDVERWKVGRFVAQEKAQSVMERQSVHVYIVMLDGREAGMT